MSMRSRNQKITDIEEAPEVTDDDHVNFFKGLLVSCTIGAAIYAALIIAVLHFV